MLDSIVSDPQDADLSERNSPFQPYAPVAAVHHVAETAPLPAITPLRRHRLALPFAPWRFMALAVIVLTAIPCGFAAAAPGISGAELSIGMLLAVFVAVFAIPGRDIR